MFSFATVLYFLGQQPALLYIWNNQGKTEITGMCDMQKNPTDCNKHPGFLNQMLDQFTSSGGIASLIAIGAAAIGATFLAGFAAVYILPIFILLVILNLLIVPFSLIFDPAIDNFIRVPLLVFLNILQVLALVSFVRGGA